uniref:Uncharacterized protein n=1 Tax=Anguilla anguilla TaxID=7936 RepID=A0A0E9UVN9_ANGAN
MLEYGVPFRRKQSYSVQMYWLLGINNIMRMYGFSLTHLLVCYLCIHQYKICASIGLIAMLIGLLQMHIGLLYACMD